MSLNNIRDMPGLFKDDRDGRVWNIRDFDAPDHAAWIERAEILMRNNKISDVVALLVVEIMGPEANAVLTPLSGAFAAAKMAVAEVLREGARVMAREALEEIADVTKAVTGRSGLEDDELDGDGDEA